MRSELVVLLPPLIDFLLFILIQKRLPVLHRPDNFFNPNILIGRDRIQDPLSTPDGTVLEGHEVIPNIEAELKREMLLKGIDSQLDTAIKYIK